MQNFIGIAGGDDLSRDKFIEKFRWRSVLFFFFLFLLFFFFFLNRMLLQIIIVRTCLYLQLLPNELYNSYIRILRGNLVRYLVLPLLSYISRPRLVTRRFHAFSPSRLTLGNFSLRRRHARVRSYSHTFSNLNILGRAYACETTDAAIHLPVSFLRK